MRLMQHISEVCWERQRSLGGAGVVEAGHFFPVFLSVKEEGQLRSRVIARLRSDHPRRMKAVFFLVWVALGLCASGGKRRRPFIFCSFCVRWLWHSQTVPYDAQMLNPVPICSCWFCVFVPPIGTNLCRPSCSLSRYFFFSARKTEKASP